MVKADENKIYIQRGNNATFSIELVDESTGEPYDFSEDTVVFTVKRFLTDREPLLQKTVVNGMVTITTEDTNELNFGQYFYDVTLLAKNGILSTVIGPAPFVVGEVVRDN